MLTAAQRTARKQYIGSSDSAAIMGVNPYATVYDVYLDKTGQLIDHEKESPAIDIGNMLEGPLIDYCTKETGIQFKRDVMLVHDNGILCANLDGLQDSEAPECAVECKTTGVMNPFVDREAWGFDMTDSVPDHVNIQCQHQMLVGGLRLVFVPALIGGRGLALFQIPRNDDICAAILERTMHFWNHCVVAGIPPGDSFPTLEVAKLMKREPNKVTHLEYSTIKAWLDAKAECKAAERKVEMTQALLLAAMRDAEAADTPIGRITYMEQSRGGFTVKPTTFRKLHFKKAKD